MLEDTDKSTALLCEILSTHLAGQQIDPDDDFYAMGGDSLIALRVVADAQDKGLAVTLRDIMFYPTARELGAHLADLVDEQVDSVPAGRLSPVDLALLPAGVVEALPASALQVAMIYLCETSGDPDLYHSAISWEVAGEFDEPGFRQALDELCQRHPALRTSLDLGTYSAPAQLVWSSVRPPLTVQPWEETASAEGGGPIDWGTAPLFRCQVRTRPGAFSVELVVHHAIVDGWSYGRVIVDLLSLYAAGIRGEAPELPALPEGVQQAFLEAEQRQIESSEAAEYWRRQADLPLALLTGRGRFGGVANACQSVEFGLSDELVRGLQEAARTLRLPLKSVALAAHASAFAALTGQDSEVVTGVVVNTRPQVSGSDLVAGLYLNTVPIRCRVTGSWAEIASAALAAERDSSPYQSYPLAHIENQLGRPAFEVTFNFTNFHVYQELSRLDELAVSSWQVRGKPSFPFRVDFEVADIEAGNRVGVAFDPDLLPAGTAQRYAALFEQALIAFAADPMADPTSTAG
ncbi:MAG: condensation domain-containing protein [Jatrophihabitantaceae bacterium]